MTKSPPHRTVASTFIHYDSHLGCVATEGCNSDLGRGAQESTAERSGWFDPPRATPLGCDGIKSAATDGVIVAQTRLTESCSRTQPSIGVETMACPIWL
jgi:hypothetical protein